MAATQRAANASAASAEPAGGPGGCEDGETTLDQCDGEEGLGATGQPQVTLKLRAQAPAPSSRKAAGHRSKVNSGQLLGYNDVDELGKNKCKTYLRAMGKTVTRSMVEDLAALRRALKEELRAFNVGPGQAWSVARDTDGEGPPQAEGGAEPAEKVAPEGTRSGDPVATCSPRTDQPLSLPKPLSHPRAQTSLNCGHVTCILCVTGPDHSGARRWKTRIDQGHPLQYDEVEQMSGTGCVEYLRAMGETVSRRQERNSVSSLRHMLMSALSQHYGIGAGQTWRPDATMRNKQQQKRRRTEVDEVTTG